MKRLGLIARADDAEVKSVIDKAVEAIGGEEALKKAGAYCYTGRSLRTKPDGTSAETFNRTTVQGIDHFRGELSFTTEPVAEGEPPEWLSVLNGDRAWVKSRGQVTEYIDGGLELKRLTTAFEATLINFAALRDPSSKVEPALGEVVEGRPAVGLKVTRSDGAFTIFFDAESGLPVKGILRTHPPPAPRPVQGLTLTMTLRDYKDVGGLKVATRRIAQAASGGVQKQVTAVDIIDFKVLDKVDPATFARPE